MGIYDREYYRREGPSLLTSITQRGQMCKWLIGVNVVFYIIQLVTRQLDGSSPGPSPFTDALVLNTDAVFHGQVWRLLTYAFLHDPGSIMHIVFNMWLLWLFGTDVEDIYGPREFLAMYLASAVLGGAAFVLTTSMGLAEGKTCLGASGAVTAVMVLCAFHYPTKVILLFFLLPVPIWLFVGFNVVQDAFGFLSQQRSGVAVTVHLGGALFAMLYYKRHWRLLPLVNSLGAWLKQRNRPRLRVYREEPPEPARVAAAAPPVLDADEQLEAKLDAVLEKVARFGQTSLTDGERQILLRASEVYKRRRT